jgi:hypothetical protein
MKERPILFKAEMVRAILDGRKTQTRRAVKPQPASGVRQSPFSSSGLEDGHGRELSCPYGKPGDQLWVRETWRIGAWDHNEGSMCIDYQDGPDKTWRNVPDSGWFEREWIAISDELTRKKIGFNAKGNYHWAPGQSPLKWKPSIHMPRWASRIQLEITDLRVERLQEISEEDAFQEGVDNKLCAESVGRSPLKMGVATQSGYAYFWDKINGPGSWDANPWVWVIEFKRIKP